MTQNNLGYALGRLGERDRGHKGTALLREALGTVRDCLTVRTREREPIYWAMSFGNEGIVMTELADRIKDASMAEQGCKQIELALDTLGNQHLYAAYCKARLSKARRISD